VARPGLALSKGDGSSKLHHVFTSCRLIPRSTFGGLLDRMGLVLTRGIPGTVPDWQTGSGRGAWDDEGILKIAAWNTRCGMRLDTFPLHFAHGFKVSAADFQSRGDGDQISL